MAGFLMGLAKGATPRAATGGRTIRPFAEQAELDRLKEKEVRETKRTLDPSGPAQAEITGKYNLAGTKVTASATMHGADQVLRGIKHKTKADQKLKETADQTELAKWNAIRRNKRADNYWNVYKKRASDNHTFFNSHHETLPTFDEVQAVMSAGDIHPAYHMFKTKGWFLRKSTSQEIEDGSSHYSGFAIGSGPNGGFAVETRREKFDNATSQFKDDLTYVEIISAGVNTPQSLKAGLVFNSDKTLDRENSEPSSIAIYDRVSNFIIPAFQEYRGPEFNKKAVERYMANNDNKTNALKGLVKRKTPKQIAVDTKEITSPDEGFVEKGKKAGMGPVERILKHTKQFAAGPGSTRYKKAIESIDKDDTLYMSVLNRAMLVFENPAKFNRYEGAVNFVQETDPFAKQLKHKDGRVIGKVGRHIVGYAKTHKANSTDAYLNNITEVIKPTSREYDMIVTTALGEAEGLASQDIENIDHVLEVIRNRLYHPDFAKQREPKIQKKDIKKKGFAAPAPVVEKNTDKVPTLVTYARRLEKLGTKKDQVKNMKSMIKSVAEPLSSTNNTEVILEAFKSFPDYDYVYINNKKYPNNESKANRLIKDYNTRVKAKEDQKISSTITINKSRAKFTHMLSSDKEEFVTLVDPEGGGGEESSIDGIDLPKVATKAGAYGQLISLKNLSIRPKLGETKMEELANPSDKALARLGRWESWLQTIKLMNLKKATENKILEAFLIKEGANILRDLQQLTKVEGITKGSFVLIEPKNLPQISSLQFPKRLSPNELTGEQIITRNSNKTNSYVKFYSKGGLKGKEGGDYAYVKKVVGDDKGNEITLVYPVLNRTQDDIDNNGIFKVPELLIPNRQGRLVEMSSGKISLRDNKYIRMLTPKSNYFLKNDKEREIKVNTLLQPIKKAILKYSVSGSSKDAKDMVNAALDSLGKPESELRQALGEHYGDFKKGDLVKAIAYVSNRKFHMEFVLVQDQQRGVGGATLDVLETNPQYGLKDPNLIGTDLSYKDARMVKKSSDIVIRYMKGLLNTFLGLGAYRVTPGQVIERMSAENAPASAIEAVKNLVMNLKKNPDKAEELIKEAFDNADDRARMTTLLGEVGSTRVGGMFNWVDAIISKVKQGSALAADLVGYETNIVDSAKKAFTLGYKGTNAEAFHSMHQGKFAELEKRKAVATKFYNDSFKLTGDEKDSQGRTRTERILNARRNLYAIALTYHFAGLVQGGSGGRAISNEDFQNLYEALFGSDGPVQYSNIKRALSIAQNALYKADIIIGMKDRKGQADYVLNSVNPVLDAITDREEREALRLQSSWTTKSNNPTIIQGNTERLGTFSQKYKGKPTNKAIDQQLSLNSVFDNTGLDIMTPFQFSSKANDLGINIRNIEENITAFQFYRILDSVSEGASADFDSVLQNYLKDMDHIRFEAPKELKEGMEAVGRTMDEIFKRAADPKNTFQEQYQKIKGSFLTSYVREYVARIMTNSAFPKLDEPVFNAEEVTQAGAE
tara:strand:- start:5076 stop:9563 length:4488 start_codon:yes stop_codon:yes gene_type:complete